MSDERTEVLVFETADPTELHLARNLLEEDGIPCRVKSGGDSALLGAVLGSNFAGFHELLVPADFEDRAVRLIEETRWRGRPSGEHPG